MEKKNKKGKLTDREKILLQLEKKEARFLSQNQKDSQFKEKIYDKIPEKLQSTLEAAFQKAFEAVFLHGTKVIEKTFQKEDIMLEYEADNYIIHKKETKKVMKRLDKTSQKVNLVNGTFTAVSGIGMGFLGLGLPDIPVLTATILQGIYQIALSYGYSYESDEEKIYILRLIRTALTKDASKQENNDLLDHGCENTELAKEIALTAKVLSDALLVEKFIQGIPVIGAAGGLVNFGVYRKITGLCSIKYKKRYLLQSKNPLD